MPGISFGGLASGLPPNLVDQLVEAERLPLKKIEERKGNSEAKLTLVNDLESKLRGVEGNLKTLASVKGFNDMKLQSGDPKIIDGTVDPSSSVSGQWNVEVLELAEKAAAMTNGFPDKDTSEIGVGYFRFQTPDGEKEVYINGDNNTLQGAANTINQARVGVKASVINDRKEPDAPYKLVISSDTVGEESRIEYSTLYLLDGDDDLYFDDTREAKNGLIKFDGFEVEIDDNVVDNLIPGVALNIKKAAPGDVVTLAVSEDREIVTGKIGEFVSSLNEVLNFIQSQNRLNENSDTSRTLGGDGLLRSVESRLRQLIQGSQPGTGSIRRLSQMGIEFNRNGTLDLKQEKFETVLASKPDEVAQFFAGDGFNVGFIPAIKRTVDTLLNSAFGPVSLRKRSLQNKINQFDQRIDSKERQLAKKEQALRRKFAKLEETMSRLKSQGGAVAGLGGGAPSGLKLG